MTRSRSSRRHRRSRSPIRSTRKQSSRYSSRSRSRSFSRSPSERGRPGKKETSCDRSPRRRENKTKKPKNFTHLVDKWGKAEEEEKDDEESVQPVEKPNFGLSGALAKDRATGNIQNGVVMKWSEPAEARVPTKPYRLYVFKDDTLLSTLHVHRKSAFLVGRDKTIADILTEHASCSKQHAVLQYRLFQQPTADGLSFEQHIRPYIMDLGSTNGTMLNGQPIESARYIELKVKDVLKFGESTREYVFMDAS